MHHHLHLPTRLLHMLDTMQCRRPLQKMALHPRLQVRMLLHHPHHHLRLQRPLHLLQFKTSMKGSCLRCKRFNDDVLECTKKKRCYKDCFSSHVQIRACSYTCTLASAGRSADSFSTISSSSRRTLRARRMLRRREGGSATRMWHAASSAAAAIARLSGT